MNWLLGILVVGLFVIAGLLLRQQIRADRDFMDWLERNCGGK